MKVNTSTYIIYCYGITKDPETNNFMIVMNYAKDGSLRQNLDKNFNSMDWKFKLNILSDIAIGLNAIHKEWLIHRDFHSGNILHFNNYFACITDLGLCKPANEKSEKNVYGVLPYIAPEVLRGKEYTQNRHLWIWNYH